VSNAVDLNELIIMKKLKHHKYIAECINGGIHCRHHDSGQEVLVPTSKLQILIGNNLRLPKIIAEYGWIQMQLYQITLRQAITNSETHNYFFRIKIMTQLVDAIDHLRRLKITHCDVKPENIFLDVISDVKLGDFGIAKECYENNWVRAQGTEEYMAYEIMKAMYAREMIP
ncbi:protein kinase-like protein, partial [Leptotrombidium deliense]